ncbi:MAG: hypothetical protein QOI59_5879 [Gammaproteobacteria bacterium]|nr:hypothetical protein [Gammaproteobacteria bacterium]
MCPTKDHGLLKILGHSEYFAMSATATIARRRCKLDGRV